jgi:glycosyltransferase involved in cell wall biosynthesis
MVVTRGRSAVVPGDRRLRILYVQAAGGGGSGTGLHQLLRTLDHEQFEPIVLVYERTPQCDDFSTAGARVVVLNEVSNAAAVRGLPGKVRRGRIRAPEWRSVRRLVARDVGLARRILPIVRAERIDLVHHNNQPPGNRPSILAARWARVPQVAHVRFLPRYALADRFVARSVDRFVFVSQAVQLHATAGLGRATNRGQVVYDPFDFAAFDVAAGRSGTIRRELGIADEAFVVTNVGRLVPWKGQDVFLRAVAEVAREHPQVSALIVGEAKPTPADQDYHRRLRALVDELGIADRVHFAGFRTDIPEILVASDLAVHSATKPEPFGRVVVEAMAARRPVIATGAGGVLEIVQEGETGLLVPLGDAAAMAAAIRRFVEHGELGPSMGERARADVETRFSEARFRSALHKLYGSTLGLRPSSGPRESRNREAMRA